MIIGGDFYKHSGYGIEYSWLFTPCPDLYLLCEEDLIDEDTDSWTYKTIVAIMEANFPNFIFEIPWIKDDDMRENKRPIVIKNSQSPILYYQPNIDNFLKGVRYVCEIPWDALPKSWDDNEFRDFINRVLEKRKAGAKIEKAKAGAKIEKAKAEAEIVLVNEIQEKL